MSKILKIFQNVGQGSNPGSAGSADSSSAGGFRSFTELCKDAENNADGGTSGGAGDPRELARREAEETVAKAREDAARIEQEAYDKGFAKGEQDGLAEGEKKLAEEIGKVEGFLKTLNDQIVDVQGHHEQNLLVLVKAMVDRLVNHEVSVNPMVIQSCLKKTMDYVVENSVVKVHLHTDDFNRLKEAGLTNPALFEGKNRVQLIEDPNISLGGCLVSTDFGEIDATLESCRDKLYAAVDQALMAALAEDTSNSTEASSDTTETSSDITEA